MDGNASSSLTNSGEGTSGEKPIRLGTEFEDRISSLPDPILIHILSFLPTRDAVKTIAMRRFGNLWASVDNLEFDSCSYHDCVRMTVDADARCLKLIRGALDLHSSITINKFKLVFPFSYKNNPDREGETESDNDSESESNSNSGSESESESESDNDENDETESDNDETDSDNDSESESNSNSESESDNDENDETESDNDETDSDNDSESESNSNSESESDNDENDETESDNDETDSDNDETESDNDNDNDDELRLKRIEKRKLAKEVDSWILFCVRKHVKILHLDTKLCTICDPERCYRVPNDVFRSCFLTEMHLVQCKIKPRGLIHMQSLKKLSLLEMAVRDRVIRKILAGCPKLEDLSLQHCFKLRNLNLTSTCLTKLVICYWEATEKLELSCLYVRSLDISGRLDLVNLTTVSPLDNARLQLSYHLPFGEIVYHSIRGIFEKLRHAEVLNISTRCIMVFTICELRTLPCPSYEWKQLVLETRLTKWNLLGIAGLLRNSPHLESLKIEVQHGGSAFHGEEAELLTRYDYDEANYWSTLEHFDCLKNELKHVYIYANENGSVIHPHVIQLVKFLLKSSQIMEKIVITLKPDGELNWTERVLEFTRELTSFPKASRRAVILFN